MSNQQVRARKKKATTVARYEAALREIAACGHHHDDRYIARQALNPTTNNGE